MQREPFSRLARRLGGFASERPLPAFAGQSFRAWFSRHTALHPHGRPVLLFPDTFNNYFHPDTAIAATEVLESQGWRVEIPAGTLCCGRPLYDHGMLSLARRQLQQLVAALEPAVEANVPIVVLEPSCAAVFRDELPSLLADDPRAARLARQTRTLSELLSAEGHTLPGLPARALVHQHCHHKAVLGTDADHAILDDVGVEYEVLDSGCCGLAGAFGFNRRHYDVSMAIGERVLLPAVREAAPDTIIVADGFSCREQIAHGTGRHAVHLAELLQRTVRRPSGDEERWSPREIPKPVADPVPALAVALTGAGILLAALLGRRAWANGGVFSRSTEFLEEVEEAEGDRGNGVFQHGVAEERRVYDKGSRLRAALRAARNEQRDREYKWLEPSRPLVFTVSLRFVRSAAGRPARSHCLR